MIGCSRTQNTFLDKGYHLIKLERQKRTAALNTASRPGQYCKFLTHLSCVKCMALGTSQVNYPEHGLKQKWINHLSLSAGEWQRAWGTRTWRVLIFTSPYIRSLWVALLKANAGSQTCSMHTHAQSQQIWVIKGRVRHFALRQMQLGWRDCVYVRLFRQNWPSGRVFHRKLLENCNQCLM